MQLYISTFFDNFMKIVNICFVISFFLCRTTVSFPRNVPNLQKRKVTLHLTFSNKNFKKNAVFANFTDFRDLAELKIEWLQEGFATFKSTKIFGDSYEGVNFRTFTECAIFGLTFQI